MNSRLASCARCSLWLSVTGLFLAGPMTLIAQTGANSSASGVQGASGFPAQSAKRNPQQIAKSAVQRELDAIYSRRGKKKAPPLHQGVAAREIQKGPIASDGHTVVRRTGPVVRHQVGRKSIGSQPASGSGLSPLKRFWKPLSAIFRRNRSRSMRAAPQRTVTGSKSPALRHRPISPAAMRSVIRQTAAETASPTKTGVSAAKNAAPAAKSAAPSKQNTKVQQHLEELYQRDGRQMPSMKLSELPKTTEAAKKTTQSRDLTKRVPATHQKRDSAPNFLQRLFPFSNRKHRTPPRTTAHARRHDTPHAHSHSPSRTRSLTHRPPAGTNLTRANKRPGLLPSFLMRRRTKQPSAQPRQTQQVARQAASIQKPQTKPQIKPEQIAKAKSDAKLKPAPTKTAEEGLGGMENPFPDVSETEADRRTNPFTGLTLDDNDQDDKVSEKPVASEVPNDGPAVAKKPDADPKLAETPHRHDPEIKEPTVAKKATAAPKSVATSHLHEPEIKNAKVVADKKSTQAEDDSDKMRRIAERKGQTGLKGFCPVALRDRRDLVDSNPHFASSYGTKIYTFSSSEAKEKFDANPSKYAPAADGYDVVLMTGSGDLVDGSLDHAVWYRNRLYLFNGRKSLQTFVLEPAQYAVAGE